MGALPPQAKPAETNPQIYLFGNDYLWKLAKELVDDPTNQVDKVSEDILAGITTNINYINL